MNKYKFELQGNKFYWLETKEVEISEFFGTLATFNYDPPNNFKQGNLILNLFKFDFVQLNWFLIQPPCYVYFLLWWGRDGFEAIKYSKQAAINLS